MPSKSRRGFTLVELLIVMAVIGVVTGTVLIRTNFTEGGEDEEFRQIVTFLRRQHARTLRSSKALTVRFNPGERRILVVDDNDEVLDRFPLDRWSLENTRELSVSPWSAQSGRLTFVNESGREKNVARDWILGFETNVEPRD